jgi:hypothetical protein
METINISSLNLTLQQQSQLLNENLSVRINELNPILHWTPNLFIANAIGQFGEQDQWITIKRNIQTNHEALSPPIVNLYICQHRRIKGFFWEKLELNHVLIYLFFFLLIFSFI